MSSGSGRRDGGAETVHIFSRPLKVLLLRGTEGTSWQPALARAARLARPGVVELLVQPAPPALGLARWVPRGRVRLFTGDRPDGLLDEPPPVIGVPGLGQR